MNEALRPPRKPLGWSVIVCWAVCVASVSQIPNWIGRASAGRTTFLGTLAPWPEDLTYHLSFAEQARRGALLFEDKYNGNRVETRLIFNPYFLALGRSARLLGLSVVDASLAAKALLAVLLLCAAWLFAAPCLETRVQQVLFLILAACGSGLGWLSAWGLTPPFDSIDQWAVEASSFFAMADDMIVPITTTLLLLGLDLLRRALSQPSRRRAVACGAVALVLGMVHPHDLLVTFYALAFGVVLLQSLVPALRETPPGQAGGPSLARWQVLLWVVACSAPVLAYDAYVLWREPLFWSYVSLDDALRPASLAAGFGLPLALGVLGAVSGLRRAPARFLFPVLWIALACVLLFVPIPPCRQFFLLHGLQIGLGLLAARTLAWIWERVREGALPGRRLLAPALVAALVVPCCLTSVVQWQRWSRLLHERSPERFVPPELASGLRWLGEHADPASTLLAGEAASRLAPPLAGLRVFAAQEQQTVDYARWRDAVRSFYDAAGRGAGRPQARVFLDRHGIRYLLVGVEERRLGGPGLLESVAALPGWTKVLESPGLALFARSAGDVRDVRPLGAQ